MNEIIVIATCVSALAMVVIAWFAYQSHRLAQKIDQGAGEYREQLEVLFKAIATSSLIGSGGQPSSAEFGRKVTLFNKWNEGGLTLDIP
jgi:hypothetical protein